MVVAYETISATRISALARSVLFTTRKPADYGGADNVVPGGTDPLHSTGEITDAIKVIDREVSGAIKSTRGHRLWRLFFEQAAVTDGQEVADVPLGGVLIDDKPGKKVPPDVLRRYKNNNLSLSTATGYYSWHGGIFSFVGTAALIDVIKVPAAGFPLTPIDCEGAVYFGVMAAVFPKDGKFTEAQANFASLYKASIEAIKLGGDGEKMPQVEIAGFGG